MATVLHIDTIVSDPEVRGGKPIIAGTRICVSDIVNYYIFDKQTPEELAAGYKLPLGQIHAALAYYHIHQDEIDEEMRTSTTRAEQLIEKLEAAGKKVIRF